VIVSFNQSIPNYEFQVARVASDGTYTYYTITEMFNPSAGPSIVAGSDGDVYVQDSEHVAKVTPAGEITVYSTATSCKINPPEWVQGLTLGPDGNVWFISNCSSTYPPTTSSATLLPLVRSPLSRLLHWRRGSLPAATARSGSRMLRTKLAESPLLEPSPTLPFRPTSSRTTATDAGRQPILS